VGCGYEAGKWRVGLGNSDLETECLGLDKLDWDTVDLDEANTLLHKCDSNSLALTQWGINAVQKVKFAHPR